MSAFWSGWVKFLIVLNLGVTLFLFIASLRMHIPTTADGTTGHVWAHGVIREGVRRLPLWWVVFSAAMFVCGFTYLALYPGFGSFKGVLNWTSADEWQRDTLRNETRLAALVEPWRDLTIEQLAAEPRAIAIGERLYQDNCAACHGAEARGSRALGAPSLADGDWLYGGDGDTILASIRDGRSGVMPPWGPALGDDGVDDVVTYVLSLGGFRGAPARIAAGKAHFDTLCVACHGADGRGNQTLGAPDLTDRIWLYGGTRAAIAESVRGGRSGVMPAWGERLDPDQLRVLAAWVYARSSRAAP